MDDKKLQVTQQAEPSYTTTAIFTVPNILSFLRLGSIPVFLWLVLALDSSESDLWAVVILGAASFTDLIDGRVARALNQVSRLGEMLDPISDRLYILAIVIALGIRGILPIPLVVALLARDLVLVLLVPVLRRSGYTSLPVHLIGKAATFFLLIALPLILLGHTAIPFAVWAKVLGWAIGLWGIGMYWWAALLYLRQTVALTKQNSRQIDKKHPTQVLNKVSR